MTQPGDIAQEAQPADNPRRNWLRRLGPTGILALLWTAMPAIAGTVLIFNIGTASVWLNERPQAGVFIYITVFVLGAGLGLLPTYAQAILGGWVFGFALGFPAALVGFVGGALLGYIVARTVSRHRVEDLIQTNIKARAIRDALIGHGFWRTLAIVALLRMPPNSPFALTNLVMASTGVPKRAFVLGTAIGMAPRTGIAIFLAASAASTGARDLQTFIKEGPEWAPGWLVLVVGLATMFVVLGIIGAIANRALERVSKRGAAGDPPEPGPGDRAEADGAEPAATGL